MSTFLAFTITGDPAFDLFFSFPATTAILSYIASIGFNLFRGRI